MTEFKDVSPLISVIPENPRTNVPLRLESQIQADVVLVRPEQTELWVPEFSVPLQLEGDVWVADFKLDVPGLYQLSVGQESYALQVAEQNYLPFATEFGIFYFVVILLLGGLFIWLRQSKSKKI